MEAELLPATFGHSNFDSKIFDMKNLRSTKSTSN